ncbi:MAG: hypothetical protein JKY65_04380 [Planctomycetes bacterium]|nr:hypothetical protein [Planctomycetota bacterium]
MSRSSKWIAVVAIAGLFGFASPSICQAAPEDAETENAFKALSTEQQKELRTAAELIGAGAAPDSAEVMRHINAAAAYGTAANSAAQSAGMAARLESVQAQIDGQKAVAERNREANDRPSVWEKAGSQLLQGLLAALLDVGKQKLNDWINGGGEDDKLLDQIRDLEDERTRLEDELNGGGPGAGDNGGLGEVITDPNGNTGYDTDGNGFVDIPLYPNGTPGSPGNDSNPIVSAPGSVTPGPLTSTDPRSLDKDDTSLPANLGGGGASRGGNSGPGFNFGGGANTPDAAAAAGGLAAAGEDKDGDGIADDAAAAAGGLSKADSDAAGGIGSSGKDDGSDDLDEDGVEMKKKFGRIIVLPKLEFGDLAGNRKANDNWNEEWKDDSWDDAADNGDFDEDWADDEDWGGEWDAAAKKGEKAPEGADDATTTAEDQETAELVDQIIRVETAVAEWRKLEAKAKEAGVDPYGFKDEEMGYRASGDEEKDPFKDVRTKDGKIDLTKVDVWLIEEETWKDGEEPIRYRLKIDPEEIIDFEPIHGGVAMIQGVLSDVDVDKRVLDEIKGKVKEIEVRRVLLSAEKPPEDPSELDGTDSEDEDGEEDTDGLDTPAKKSLDAPKKTEGDDDGWDDEGW